jgi:hypothetical protein
MSNVAACVGLLRSTATISRMAFSTSATVFCPHAAAGIDDAIHGGRADAGAGCDLGDAWSPPEQRQVAPRIGPAALFGLM